jgi:hypothetical protein
VEFLLTAGARVGNSDTGDGSLQTASSFGFANGVNAERKLAINNLLIEAIERENKIPTRLSEHDPYLTAAYSAGELATEAIKIYEAD